MWYAAPRPFRGEESQTLVGTEVGTHNPEAFPRHLVGVGVPGLDHSLILAEDVRLMENMLREVFGFYATERVQTDLDDSDAHYIATWMTSNNQIHQLAVLEGPQGKLHHVALKLQDWSEVGHAGDLFAMDDVPIDIGPTRHGITHGQTIYFFDPSGRPRPRGGQGSRQMPGVSSAGLMMHPFPQAIAAAIFHVAIMSGKFQGEIAATTPAGPNSLYVWWPLSIGITSPTWSR